jgi:hypothetical protein
VCLAPPKLKDVCRIGWGKVLSIKKTKAMVEYRPIIKKNKFLLGGPIKKEIYWNKKIVPKLKKGSWVSFHWDTICQEISQNQKINLEKYTKNTLEILK